MMYSTTGCVASSMDGSCHSIANVRSPAGPVPVNCSGVFGGPVNYYVSVNPMWYP